MKKIWKWRWILVIIIICINIIVGIIPLFISTGVITPIIIIIVIDAISSLIYKIIIVPKLKEVEEKEKIKDKELKRYDGIKKVIELLENYEFIKNNEQKEIICVEEIGKLFPDLEKIKFQRIRDTTLKDHDYEVIYKPVPSPDKFLIRTLIKGMRVKTSKEYFSYQYTQSRTEQSDSQVLTDFIKHLMKRINYTETSTKKEKKIDRDLKKIINLLKVEPKSDTIFMDIISIFHKNDKILDILMMPGYIQSDRIQIENNLWSFFIMCTFNDSKIMIGKAGNNEGYLFKGEKEQNPKIRDGFIEYILSKLTK